jgi:hypothetical protein
MMDSLEPSIAAQVAALSAYQDLHFKVPIPSSLSQSFFPSTTEIKAFVRLTGLKGTMRLISSAGAAASIMAETASIEGRMFIFEIRVSEADTNFVRDFMAAMNVVAHILNRFCNHQSLSTTVIYMLEGAFCCFHKFLYNCPRGNEQRSSSQAAVLL